VNHQKALSDLQIYEVRKRKYSEEDVEVFICKSVEYRGKLLHPRAFAKMVAEFLWEAGYPESYVSVPDLSVHRFLLRYTKNNGVFEHNANSLIEHANKLAVAKVKML
jgi:hypothetical protein